MALTLLRTATATLVAAVAAISLTIAGDARAESCGMGDIDWYGGERANVATAEALLSEGDTEDAAWLMQRTWPRLREALPVEGSLPVITEGVRVMALAAVRSGGSLKNGLGWSSTTAEQRANNVAWGVSRLRMIVAADPSSDAARTDLGEALARSEATHDEARALLEALSGANGVATPEGLAALALLRAEAGRVGDAKLAADQCAEVAAVVSVQCAAPANVAPADVITAAR